MIDLIEIEGIIATRADWEFIRDLLRRKQLFEGWRSESGTRPEYRGPIVVGSTHNRADRRPTESAFERRSAPALCVV